MIQLPPIIRSRPIHGVIKILWWLKNIFPPLLFLSLAGLDQGALIGVPVIKSGFSSEPATNFIFYGTDGDPSTASKLGWANTETSVFHFLDTPVNYQDKALYQDREAAFSRPMFLPGKFSSGAQSRLTLCNPMDYSTQGLPVHHQLSEFTQTHVHWVGDAIQPFHPLSSLSPPTFNICQHQGLFRWVSSLHQVAKVLEFQLQHQSFQRTPRNDLL